MWPIIKKSVKQHLLIWWTVSCFILALSGGIYIATRVEPRRKNAYGYLILWSIVWGFITFMGVFTGFVSQSIDKHGMNNAEDKEQGFNAAAENEGRNADEMNNFDTAVICREDGPVFGEQFV